MRVFFKYVNDGSQVQVPNLYELFNPPAKPKSPNVEMNSLPTPTLSDSEFDENFKVSNPPADHTFVATQAPRLSLEQLELKDQAKGIFSARSYIASEEVNQLAEFWNNFEEAKKIIKTIVRKQVQIAREAIETHPEFTPSQRTELKLILKELETGLLQPITAVKDPYAGMYGQMNTFLKNSAEAMHDLDRAVAISNHFFKGDKNVAVPMSTRLTCIIFGGICGAILGLIGIVGGPGLAIIAVAAGTCLGALLGNYIASKIEGPVDHLQHRAQDYASRPQFRVERDRNYVPEPAPGCGIMPGLMY